MNRNRLKDCRLKEAQGKMYTDTWNERKVQQNHSEKWTNMETYNSET